MNGFISAKKTWCWILALLGMTFFLTACDGGHRAPPSTPVITAQPVDVSVVAGSAASFSVTATGRTPAYQWQISNNSGTSWSDIAGATVASYTLATTTLSDSGHLFRVLVTAAGATVASSPAQLTVTTAVEAPAITVQPTSQTVTEPATATFSVTATGTSLQYKWQLSTNGSSWNDISGATTASYTTPATSASASGAQFRVQVSNTAGSVTSNAAALTINPASSANAAPSFTTQPASQSVAEGSSATFSASVTGTPTPTLQWQRSNNSGGSWMNIAGATNSSYTIAAVVADDSEALFRLSASNSEGLTNSDQARLTVTPANAAPVFITQPQDASVDEGASAHFSAEADGVPNPGYQWQVSSNGGGSWSNINGATSDSYDTPATVVGDNGKQYRVVASNSVASINSDAAALTVSALLTAKALPLLTVGDYHSCAVKTNGEVACWGSNEHGQLGNGSKVDSYIPVTVSGVTNAVAVAAGDQYSCALKQDGSVACWGYNASGQLGNGSTTDSITPATVSGLSNVVAINAGYLHSCGIKTDGTVACWGDNSSGELGNGSTTNSLTPTAVSGLNNVVAIAAGMFFNCALKADGTVACWGADYHGELGDNSTLTSSVVPVTVPGLTNVVAIAAGDSHSCALKADGAVACWGDNPYGQLGDGSASNTRRFPVPVSGLGDAVAIAAGHAFSCAAKSDGTVACWGNNFYGQLGDGSTAQYSEQLNSLTPAAVSSVSNVVAIAAGFAAGCALKTDGAIACWGLNGHGELGDGNSNTIDRTPVTVSGGAVFGQ